jgi:hypothetical protein
MLEHPPLSVKKDLKSGFGCFHCTDFYVAYDEGISVKREWFTQVRRQRCKKYVTEKRWDNAW